MSAIENPQESMASLQDPPARRARARSSRAGFTLIELLLVVVIVSILAGLAIPNYKVMVIKARAADVLGRIRVVQVGVHEYLGKNSAWPAESGPGVVPTGVAPFLPENFSFVSQDFQLDWENGGGLIGVAVVTNNTQLGDALVSLSGNSAWFVSGNRYVFIIRS